jgi:choline dehydrogenase-like flavoprotein
MDMTTWHDYLKKEGQAPSWPYPIRFEKEQEIETDLLVIGGGIAGCWAAISAARTGVKVVLLEKGTQSGAAPAYRVLITGVTRRPTHEMEVQLD